MSQKAAWANEDKLAVIKQLVRRIAFGATFVLALLSVILFVFSLINIFGDRGEDVLNEAKENKAAVETKLDESNVKIYNSWNGLYEDVDTDRLVFDEKLLRKQLEDNKLQISGTVPKYANEILTINPVLVSSDGKNYSYKTFVDYGHEGKISGTAVLEYTVTANGEIKDVIAVWAKVTKE